MNNKIYLSLLIIILLICLIFASGCSQKNKFIGTWVIGTWAGESDSVGKLTFTKDNKLIIESENYIQIFEYSVNTDEILTISNLGETISIKFYFVDKDILMLTSSSGFSDFPIKLVRIK